MQFLIRLIQTHESFRIPELTALATLRSIPLTIISYSEKSPFAILELSSAAAAKKLIERAVLCRSIHELWGAWEYTGGSKACGSKENEGLDEEDELDRGYESLFTDIKARHAWTQALASRQTKHLTPGASSEQHENSRGQDEQEADEWAAYRASSFRFRLDTYQGSRTPATQRQIIDSFAPHLPGLRGAIELKRPEVELTVCEFHPSTSPSPPHPPNSPRPPTADRPPPSPRPTALYLGRLVAISDRDAIQRFDLKKRRYISTTSMDAELSLVSSNLALCAPGKLVYDPFCGTGSFLVAAGYHGAVAVGSDMDGRSLRGKPVPTVGTGVVKGGKGAGVVTGGERASGWRGQGARGNFAQYGIEDFGGLFVADLTNSPVRCGGLLGDGEERAERWVDAVICDPPYGIREGLKVLGSRKVRTLDEAEERRRRDVKLYVALSSLPERVLILRKSRGDSYLPPKKHYSFSRLLNDILSCSAAMLVDGGRLCLWMPVANETSELFPIPTHPRLRLLSCCVQDFGKWARRLLTYERILESEVQRETLGERGEARAGGEGGGGTADELNPFRRGYFAPSKLSETEGKAEDGDVERRSMP